ncbi:unnamed protein product, partial [Mesorhabditis spiculigera]
MQGIFDNQFPKLKAALLCVDSIGQRQENLWSNKQWKAIGFKIRTLYSRQPGAHTIHDIRRIDSKWMDKDRVHQVYSEAEAAKDELYGTWASRVKQVWKDKMMKDAEKALQLELIKQEMVDRYKAETEKVYMVAVQAAKEYQQAYLDGKAAQRQAIADGYNEFKQIVNASIESKVAQAKEKNMARCRHRGAPSGLKDKLATIYNQLETQGNELKADGERLGADLKAFMEKRYQYKQDGHGAAKEVLKEVLTESLEQAGEEARQGYTSGDPYRSFSLGNCRLVLLALCILLSVALIALIAYQVAQKNKYGKLRPQWLAPSEHPSTRRPHSPTRTRSPSSVPDCRDLL